MIKSKLMPPSSGPAKDWYPNPSGEGFRYWDGREWGEERPAASDAQRDPGLGPQRKPLYQAK
jgi:hypothetical protein